jgi:hypothetical protein
MVPSPSVLTMGHVSHPAIVSFDFCLEPLYTFIKHVADITLRTIGPRVGGTDTEKFCRGTCACNPSHCITSWDRSIQLLGMILILTKIY